MCPFACPGFSAVQYCVAGGDVAGARPQGLALIAHAQRPLLSVPPVVTAGEPCPEALPPVHQCPIVDQGRFNARCPHINVTCFQCLVSSYNTVIGPAAWPIAFYYSGFSRNAALLWDCVRDRFLADYPDCK